MATGEVGWVGAAVWLTAAAMPGACVRFECFQSQKTHISMNNTHLFTVPFAFSAALGLSRGAGAVGLGGAAVWLTAAAVPPRELLDSNVAMVG